VAAKTANQCVDFPTLDLLQGTKVCRYSWHSAGSLGWPFLMLKYKYFFHLKYKGKGSPYSITERRVPELTPVFGRQLASDVSHKPGGRLPLLSARPEVTPATLKRAATNFAAW